MERVVVNNIEPAVTQRDQNSFERRVEMRVQRIGPVEAVPRIIAVVVMFYDWMQPHFRWRLAVARREQRDVMPPVAKS